MISRVNTCTALKAHACAVPLFPVNKVLSPLVAACASIGGDTFSAAGWGVGGAGVGCIGGGPTATPTVDSRRVFFFYNADRFPGRVQLLLLRGVWMCVKIHESRVLAWPRGTESASQELSGKRREPWVRLHFFSFSFVLEEWNIMVADGILLAKMRLFAQRLLYVS